MTSIVQIVQHLRPGGIETMALDLARFSRHPDCLIISLEGNKQDAIAAWPRLEAVADRLLFLNKPAGVRPGLIIKLVQLLRRIRPLTVHTHHIGPLIYAGTAARLAGIQHLIHTEHDAWHLSQPRRRQLQGQLLALLRPTLVADSHSVACSLKEYFPARTVQTIRNGIDSEQFVPGNPFEARRKLHLPLNALLVGCSGRLEAVKGQHLLIEALAGLDEKIHVVLAGSGSLEQRLRDQAEQAGVSERVHFLGHLDSMPTFYRAIDLFCLPSYQEGFPLSPLEAQACGVPSIVTNVGGSAETVCPFTGSTISQGDAKALTASIAHMLRRPPNHSPRTFVTEQGDVRDMVKAYESLSGEGVR
ncbi:glycosyl transferase [Bacterioplanes sanyensis]|uniref:Glycosyl transferase n=1 Tax=Bacterioplanes sanyensis TaxID=1249553 RepID=A0A222FKT1_9GAMM|nr:glycosyltransferase [Bacterioplanes sanyensis]ASP39647.1 glycosyl transferase [Bacterioplanes sanyensis]